MPRVLLSFCWFLSLLSGLAAGSLTELARLYRKRLNLLKNSTSRRCRIRARSSARLERQAHNLLVAGPNPAGPINLDFMTGCRRDKARILGLIANSAKCFSLLAFFSTPSWFSHRETCGMDEITLNTSVGDLTRKIQRKIRKCLISRRSSWRELEELHLQLPSSTTFSQPRERAIEISRHRLGQWLSQLR